METVLSTPGGADPWASVFSGYRSACDWPSCDYWRELLAAFPQAKVVLTVRDPDAWFRSTQETIFSPLNILLAEATTPAGKAMRAIADRHFEGRTNDRASCLAGFERHYAAVKREVPPEQLLVYSVSEGWEPLCRFLGVDVPGQPFPHANTTDEFRARAPARLAGAIQ